jgi:hypothetical protein
MDIYYKITIVVCILIIILIVYIYSNKNNANNANNADNADVIKDFKTFLSIFSVDMIDKFSVNEQFNQNELIKTMDDIRNNMYKIFTLIFPDIDINKINLKCADYGIKLTIETYCNSFKTLTNIDAYNGIQNLANDYYRNYLINNYKYHLYNLFYYFLYIVNRNLNIDTVNTTELSNSTEKISYIKLALNNDYETSSKIKLYFITDKNKNKDELDILNSEIVTIQPTLLMNKTCLIDNLCYKDVTPKIFPSSMKQNKKDGYELALKEMLEYWIIYTIGKRYYELNNKNNTIFNFKDFSKELVNKTNLLHEYVRQTFGASLFKINKIEQEYALI